jgi:hemin uptake protein HemP
MTTLTLPRQSFFPSLPTRPAQPKKLRLRSEELFRDACELIIEHRGEEYRLKLTRNDKLILNK